jgi:hypothetical protein
MFLDNSSLLGSVFTIDKNDLILFFPFQKSKLLIFKKFGKFENFHDLLLCYFHMSSEINPECNLY